MSAAVDTSAFDAAFRKYLAKTSKTMEEAINWKSADLMLQAAHFTPKTKLSGAAFRKIQLSPQLITWRTKRKFGKFNRGQWNLVRDASAARSLGKGFMRSAFVKAGLKIPRTRHGKTMTVAQAEAAALEKSHANIRIATGQIKEMAAQLFWVAHGSRDAADKQHIVDHAFAQAFPAVTASMIAYLAGENVKNAKSVSA